MEHIILMDKTKIKIIDKVLITLSFLTVLGTALRLGKEIYDATR